MTPDQQRAVDPLRSVWVAASAGTGKTKVLTDRVLTLMLGGTPPGRILCLTFTKAAAAEMANRINETLGEWATVADEVLAARLRELLGRAPDDEAMGRARRLFARVVDVPGGMKIQTIHAFCQSLLRRFPLEANLAPGFEVMDERSAGELMAAAREELLLAARLGLDPALEAALTAVSGWLSADAFTDLMGELAKERGRLKRLLDRHGGLDGLIQAVRRTLNVADGLTEEEVVRRACRGGAFDAFGLQRACRALLDGSATDQERGRRLAAWLEDEAKRPIGFDDYLKAFLTGEGTVRKNLATDKICKAHPEVVEALRTEAERLLAVVEERKACAVAAGTAAVLRLGAGLLELYDRLKARRSFLDYDDLILKARALLEDATRRGAAQWVLFKLDGGLDHILIDEAQDTNPDQWRVIEALTEEFFAGEGAHEAPRTVFAVGDGKQSIYSFQRADPAEFERMRRHFGGRAAAAQMRWEEVALDISFRSTAAVLAAVDAVVADEAARDGVAFTPHPIVHRPHRAGHAGVVELWPAVTPVEGDPAAPWQPPLDPVGETAPSSRLARVIAGRVRGWLDRREILESRGRPVRPGDVMILVRRRTGFVDELVRALKERDVPVAGVDRMVLTDQLAVMDLMALGRFLLLPEDDLTLATVLKSPFVGLSEERLFDLCFGRGERRLWPELRRRRDEAEDFAQAHDFLHDLLARADFMPPFELFGELLGARGGRKALLARLGPEANDPIDEFLAAALAYERAGAPSLQGFLHWLETSSGDIKRDLEQGGRDEVRVMTVHGAKGLQAPIVFLPDTLQTPVPGSGLLWDEDPTAPPLWLPRAALEETVCRARRAWNRRRQEQEYRRLLYVALTRAEDRLYVCGWETRRTSPDGCWYRLVARALGAASGDGLSIESVELDLRVDAADGWSGPGLRLTTPQTAPPKIERGLDLDDLLRDEELGLWAVEAPEPEPEPSQPLTPSRPDGEEPPPRSPFDEDDGFRFKRGRLIHRLLQTLPDVPHQDREAAAERYLAGAARELPDQLRREIALETLAVLDHPNFGALFGPNSRAEVPIVGTVAGRVLSGQIDRLLVEDDAVTILDYKSNRPPPLREADVAAVYLRQMAVYREAVRTIYPDRPVRCVLLWTDGPRLMTLPDSLLDRHRPERLAELSAAAP